MDAVALAASLLAGGLVTGRVWAAVEAPTSPPAQPLRVLAVDARFDALNFVSKEGRLAAFCSGEGVRILDWINGGTVARFPITGTEQGPMSVCSRGILAAGGPGRKTLVVWNVGNEKSMATVTSPGAPFDSVACAPDGAWLAAGDHAGLVTVWDARGGLLHRLEGHIASVWALACAPDGIHLASAADDNDVCLWDARSGRLVRRLDTFTHSTFALAWAPDGKRLYLGGASRAVTVVDPLTGAILGQTPRQPQAVSSLAISPDGRLLAAGGMSLVSVQQPGALTIFDTAQFQERRRFLAHTGVVMGVAFGPDGTSVLSCSEFEPGIKVWAVP